MSHLLPRPRPLIAGLLAASVMTAAPVNAEPQPYAPAGSPFESSAQDVTADATGYGGQLSLASGGSRILRFAQPIGRIMVGDPKIADVIPLSDRALYVLGRAPGGTNLTVMPRGPAGRPLATLDMRVGYDVEGLRRAAHDIMPGEPLEVSARGDGLVLTGLLSDSAAAARAEALAAQYAPGHVVNLTRIRGAEQVMLSVRVSEVQRTALQQLGISNIQALWDPTHVNMIPPGVFTDPAQAFASIIGRSNIGKDGSIQGVFDLLEQKGLATTLAEPNLVALSGETAVFFAGGEFPVPVPQESGIGQNLITIEYKQYGVSVAFTPTVYGDTINLLVAPEVSALDQANAVTILGFKVPGITTRRAKTTVELRDGQSFAIAGLIRREFTNNMRGVPGVSDIPVIGQLSRSSGFNNNETEVVIIVTAHLAKPTTREKLLAPTDLRRAPTQSEMLFTNTLDVPLQSPGAAPPAHRAPMPAPAPQHP